MKSDFDRGYRKRVAEERIREFVPLHVVSDFSVGYGTATPSDIAQRAAEMGYHALALTDIENLYGQVEFHQACRAYGIKPVTGVELRAGFSANRPGSRRGRLVLLARGWTGYENLCRIVTERRERLAREGTTGDPVTSAEAYPEELFFLADDPAALHRLLSCDRIEKAAIRLITDQPQAPPSAAAAAVVAPETVLIDPDALGLHLLQRAVRAGIDLSTIRRLAAGFAQNGCLMDSKSVHRRFTHWPEALRETARIANACDFDVLGRGPILPLLFRVFYHRWSFASEAVFRAP